MPLVAIYPEEGTLYSDNPFYVLDAEWVDEDEAARGRAVHRLRPAPREPGADPQLRLPTGQPRRVDRQPHRRAATASTPTSPRRCSRCPQPEVLTELLDDWQDQRKPARVLLLVDVSGSMSRGRRPRHRRHQARAGQAGRRSRRSTSSTTTTRWASGCSRRTSATTDDPEGQYLELVPTGRIGDVRENLEDQGPRPVAHQRHAAVPRDPARLRGAAGGVRPRPASTPWSCSPTA